MALICLLCGCQARKTSVEYLIGVSLSNLSEQRQLVLKKEMEREAEKYGNVELIFLDASNGSYKQKKDLQQFLKYEIDLLIVTPTNVEEMMPVVNEMHEKLPVIILDRITEGYECSLFVGVDYQMTGKLAGEVVQELLETRKVKTPLVLELKSNYDGMQAQSKVWNQIMSDAGIAVRRYMVKSATGDSAEDGLDANTEVLKDVNLIFAHNDYMAIGARRSLEKIGRGDVFVVGVDGFAEENAGLEAIRRGYLDATVAVPVGGKEAIQQAVKILNHETVDRDYILLKSQIVTRENVDDFIKYMQEE